VLYILYLSDQEVHSLWKLQMSGESNCGLNKQKHKIVVGNFQNMKQFHMVG